MGKHIRLYAALLGIAKGLSVQKPALFHFHSYKRNLLYCFYNFYIKKTKVCSTN
jgi:hypothetical protein